MYTAAYLKVIRDSQFRVLAARKVDFNCLVLRHAHASDHANVVSVFLAQAVEIRNLDFLAHAPLLSEALEHAQHSCGILLQSSRKLWVLLCDSLDERLQRCRILLSKSLKLLQHLRVAEIDKLAAFAIVFAPYATRACSSSTASLRNLSGSLEKVSAASLRASTSRRCLRLGRSLLRCSCSCRCRGCS
jgi:hypothetical protein